MKISYGEFQQKVNVLSSTILREIFNEDINITTIKTIKFDLTTNPKIFNFTWYNLKYEFSTRVKYHFNETP